MEQTSRRGGMSMLEIINTYNTTTKELEAFIRSLPEEEQEPARRAAVAMRRLSNEET